jgi:2-dehydro-3-deoxyphosphogluconate aldolase / (4S)-4-hydroxy-2-oxoglutarate aldolase
MHPILPVYSHHQLSENIKVINASYKAGLRRFEFTNRNDNALDIFEELVALCKQEMPDMKLGAGTIINEVDARNFMIKGASFLISPLISQALIDFTSRANIEWIPGCATGAEVGTALNAGIPMVKLYPIKTLGGAEFIRLMRGPFYTMKFQVSGGIKGETQEVISFLEAGASIVGLGNSFFDPSLSEEQLTNKIKSLLKSLV